ncbi:MAG: hypothetical protein IKK70_03365 [Clostridia bacterium]|nr:hypothetical protein [Clostridia bacterium]
MQEILETLMLLCFGASWPISVVKNIRSKTAKSMSLQFILLIIVGYVAGITAKVVSGNVNYVLIAYLFNLLCVCTNLFVYFINKRYDAAELTEATAVSEF